MTVHRIRTVHGEAGRGYISLAAKGGSALRQNNSGAHVEAIQLAIVSCACSVARAGNAGVVIRSSSMMTRMRGNAATWAAPSRICRIDTAGFQEKWLFRRVVVK